jgi:NADH-quinone oxidoreductase subunit B
MEIEKTPNLMPIYAPIELDREEGRDIEALKARSVQPIPDPDRWLDEELPRCISNPDKFFDGELARNILITSLDAVLNWSRKYSPWPAFFGLACCSFEMMSALMLRWDMTRFGMDIMRASPRQADLIMVTGTLTWKMAPAVKMIYDQMAEPKWIIAMGSCAISGGPFADSYSVVPGVNRILPVDVYIPGCPPRPESLINGIVMLQKKIKKDSIRRAKNG